MSVKHTNLPQIDMPTQFAGVMWQEAYQIPELEYIMDKSKTLQLVSKNAAPNF